MRRSNKTPALSLVLVLAVLAGCARNPVTGSRELSLVSESQEIAMGQEGARQIEQQIGVVQDEALQRYVEGIGLAMARASERPDLPWRFRVLDDPVPNAFALPGGFIYLTRGMMSLMDSEAELASVLGHEIGHVTAKHSVSQISRAQLAQLGLGLGSIFVPEIAAASDVAGLGFQLLFLKFGRDDERQADDLGFRYSLAQGYDVREMADVFVALQRFGEARGGSSGLPSWLSTHPDPGERVQSVAARLDTLSVSLARTEEGRASFMNRVDGMVYGENPRAGYFEGSDFLHPDLRFRMRFPEGWQTRNMAQAVVAVSPDQDAIIQLTLAEQASPDAAARQFLGQQGVSPGQTARVNINGLPAVSGTFQAQTQQGTLAGLVVFVEYSGRVYQLLGYSPANRFRAYNDVFERSIGSFDQLRDRAALNKQPDRVNVIRTDREMTLVGFNRRYPSAIELDELALINQLESPESVIPAGTRVKQITD